MIPQTALSQKSKHIIITCIASPKHPEASPVVGGGVKRQAVQANQNNSVLSFLAWIRLMMIIKFFFDENESDNGRFETRFICF
jgi:hypothetical protein